jgi:hypothetical protein
MVRHRFAGQAWRHYRALDLGLLCCSEVRHRERVTCLHPGVLSAPAAAAPGPPRAHAVHLGAGVGSSTSLPACSTASPGVVRCSNQALQRALQRGPRRLAVQRERREPPAVRVSHDAGDDGDRSGARNEQLRPQPHIGRVQRECCLSACMHLR